MPTTLNVKEVAEILSCNPETVRRMCRRKELEFIKLGNSPRAALRIPINQPMISQALGQGVISQSLMDDDSDDCPGRVGIVSTWFLETQELLTLHAGSFFLAVRQLGKQ